MLLGSLRNLSLRNNLKSTFDSRAIFATLLALTLATGAEQWTVYGTSVTLMDMAASLGATSDEASWIVTLYSAAYVVSILLAHRLAHVLGNRRMLTTACLLYAGMSIGCATTTTLVPFLLMRAVQGFAGGSFLVRMLVFATESRPPAKRPVLLAAYGACFFFIGRVSAPFLSGWLADNLSWRWIFGLPVCVMLVAATLFFFFVEDRWLDDVEPYRVDIIGVLMLLIGIGCFHIVCSRGEIDGWFGSGLIVIMITSCIGSVFSFAAWQFSHWNQHPIVHLHHFFQRGLIASIVLGLLQGVQLGGSLYLIPTYLRTVESHSASQTGYWFALSGVSGMLMLSLAVPLTKFILRTGGVALLIAAITTQIFAMIWLGMHITTDTPDSSLYIPLILNGIFVGISVPAVAVTTFRQVDDQNASSARSVFLGVRQMGFSLGISLAVSLLDHRASLHSSRLIESISTRNMAVLDYVLRPSSTASLAARITKQSFALSCADVFFVMAGMASLMIPALLILPAHRRNSLSESIHHRGITPWIVCVTRKVLGQ